jgi:nucleoside-diphosphate-sugar epimerase
LRVILAGATAVVGRRLLPRLVAEGHEVTGMTRTAAAALGAPPPRHVPAWLVSLLGGRYLTYSATEQRGASNAKARRELGWSPRPPSWRQGFREALG